MDGHSLIAGMLNYLVSETLALYLVDFSRVSLWLLPVTLALLACRLRFLLVVVSWSVVNKRESPPTPIICV